MDTDQINDVIGARNYNASLKLSKIFQHAILNAKWIAWIDVVFVVKDIIVIFRKIKTILILISFKRYFSHPEK